MSTSIRLAAVLACAMLGESLSWAATGPENQDAPPPAPEDPLTTPVWQEPEVPLELGWHFLALPEYAIELALTPLSFTIGIVERYRIDKRIYDLLRNDEGTIKVAPNGKFSGSDGLGIGADLVFDNLLGGFEELRGGGLVRVNSDWEAGARFRKNLATLEGRRFELEWQTERDQNMKFYGLGNDSTTDDKRVVRRLSTDVIAAIDVFNREALVLRGRALVGYRRTRLGPGSEDGVQELGEPMDTVEPMADFRQVHDFARAGVELGYDTRDTVGRPTRGVLTEFLAQGSSDLKGTELGALGLRAQVSAFLPVLPRHRVFVVRAGVAGVAPLQSGGTVPFDDLVVLDRKFGLRGYSSGRFRDRLAWWSAVEYRYPIYEYQDTGVALSPVIFADVGRVASEVEDVASGPVRWDAGIGLRGEHESRLLLLLELGISPEGPELGFSAGKEF